MAKPKLSLSASTACCGLWARPCATWFWEQLIQKDPVRLCGWRTGAAQAYQHRTGPAMQAAGRHMAEDGQPRALCFHSHRRMTTAPRCAPLLHSAHCVTRQNLPNDCCSQAAKQHGRQEAGKRLESTCTPGFWRMSQWSLSHSRWERAGWAGYTVFCFPPAIRRFPAINFLFCLCVFFEHRLNSGDRLL